MSQGGEPVSPFAAVFGPVTGALLTRTQPDGRAAGVGPDRVFACAQLWAGLILGL